MERILVIEDNADLAYGLANNLEIEGYVVTVERDGRAGLDTALRNPPDLIVLDLMIPGLNGYQVLRSIREDELEVPILILSARGEELDKVRGFRLGADDYVTKPFGLLELMARIEALLRRSGARPRAHAAAPVRFGSVVVDGATRTVSREGREIALTPMEFDLLEALLQRSGAVASRSDLLREVWGQSGSAMTRTVDTHVAQLRRKLESDPARPEHILTVRKIGYRLRMESRTPTPEKSGT